MAVMVRTRKGARAAHMLRPTSRRGMRGRRARAPGTVSEVVIVLVPLPIRGTAPWLRSGRADCRQAPAFLQYTSSDRSGGNEEPDDSGICLPSMGPVRYPLPSQSAGPLMEFSVLFPYLAPGETCDEKTPLAAGSRHCARGRRHALGGQR